MRWKLLRRRWSVTAPRMSVRGHLPWPLRWAALALALGFSAALALWAFDLGRSLAGLDRRAADELERLRVELTQLRGEREKARAIANTADSLLTAERTVQDRLVAQLKLAEADNLALQRELGFFERLLPVGGGEGPVIRALQADLPSPGRVHYQLLVMQPGKTPAEFKGRCEITLAGTLDGKPWVSAPGLGVQPLSLKQYARVEGVLDHAPQVMVQTVSVKIIDGAGQFKAGLTTHP
jgi:hypothetical protein